MGDAAGDLQVSIAHTAGLGVALVAEGRDPASWPGIDIEAIEPRSATFEATSLTAEELGYTREMSGAEGDRDVERVNPELTDGAYHGPSRGHLQPRWAEHIGMPRGYGYGASMGAWVLDYVSGWAGEWGMVVSASAQYRNPAFTGDATILNGEVTGTRVDRRGRHLVDVAVDVRNQLDAVLAKATVEVLLPSEEQVAKGAIRDGQDLGAVR